MIVFLFAANLIVACLAVALLATYHLRYFWWKSAPGRIVVGGLVSALLVAAGGLCERLGHLAPHDWLVAFGYSGGSVVLLLATRHVVAVKKAGDRPQEKELP